MRDRMSSQENGSGTIHLVVHKRQIERGIWEELRSGNCPEYLAQLQQALLVIDAVLALPNTRHVVHYDPNRIPEDISGAACVIIYGCTRAHCLEWVSQAAIAAGATVSLSIKGTV